MFEPLPAATGLEGSPGSRNKTTDTTAVSQSNAAAPASVALSPE
ncbi:hypothetical protein [Nonomuraea sp. NPDC049695]